MFVNNESVKYFLFTCTFREDELNDKTIFRNNQLITVSNLEFDDVNNIISDVMRRPRTDTFPLSAFVYDKTKGNSFFVMQVLLQLREKVLTDFTAKIPEPGKVDKLLVKTQTFENLFITKKN